jgi:hypothetical protein
MFRVSQGQSTRTELVRVDGPAETLWVQHYLEVLGFAQILNKTAVFIPVLSFQPSKYGGEWLLNYRPGTFYK